MFELGVVSFLNARPLIAGLEEAAQLKLRFAVPAQLTGWLQEGRVDVALLPVIDILRARGHFRVLADACIGCDGETMTVRVFSQVPPDRITRLCADTDSHTSVALAVILWQQIYGRTLELIPYDTRAPQNQAPAEPPEAILLIGDKVVDPRRAGYAYEVDLGGAWRAHTGLPFVFATWAYVATHEREPIRAATSIDPDPRLLDEPQRQSLAALLSAARAQGTTDAVRIARQFGAERGWPVELAERYLARCLTYNLNPRAIEGANHFGRLCVEAGLVPPDAAIPWPAELLQPAGSDHT